SRRLLGIDERLRSPFGEPFVNERLIRLLGFYQATELFVGASKEEKMGRGMNELLRASKAIHGSFEVSRLVGLDPLFGGGSRRAFLLRRLSQDGARDSQEG